jgi:N-glycosylase/DNA lyase
MQSSLPEHLSSLYDARADEIRSRLSEYASVPRDRWFYELCFCLLTPQSSAVHANQVQAQLESCRFLETGIDVEHILRAPENYIRFHRTKHRRLHLAREQWSMIEDLLTSDLNAVARRDAIKEMVNGFGLKEASHFLRNIGHRGLAIIDRHLLTNLVVCGVYDAIPSVATVQRYREVELALLAYSKSVSIDMDELDLLFWCAQTGHILK